MFGPDSEPSRLLAWLGLGLFLTFHTQILSGFALMQPDLGDIRLIQYLFENDWRWLSGGFLERGLWQADFFYPAQNVGAYTDTLLALAPFYAPWRLLGFESDTALQAAAIGIFSANFLCAWYVLRRTLKLSSLAALAGAFVFSFAALRTARMGHLQLCGQFYALLMIAALLEAHAADATAKTIRRAVWCFFAALLAQLYSGFYQTWAIVLILLIALLIALLHAPWRKRIFTVLRRASWHAPLAALLALLGAVPWLWTYLEAAQTLGFRSFAEVQGMLPRAQSFLFSGRQNWLLGGLPWTTSLAQSLPMAHEHRLLPGVLLVAMGLAGLFLERRKALVQLSVLSVSVVLLLALYLPTLDFTLWRAVYAWLPGANAVRAVSRLGMLMLFPLALGVAFAVERMRQRRQMAALAIAAAIFCIEQFTISPRFNKYEARALVARVAAAVSQTCDAFYLGAKINRPEYAVQLDAMLASQKLRIPTLNGYSGNVPPGWPLADPSKAQGAEIAAWLHSRAAHDIRPCVLTMRYSPTGAVTVEQAR